MKNQEHHFNIEEAVKYGIEKAILLYNLRFWLEKNKANEKHKYKYIDGKEYYWTFNSSQAFFILFPYMSERSISRYLSEMEKDNIILIGNYNKKKYDKTKWYSMAEFETSCQNGESVRQNGEWISQNGEPIPYIPPFQKQNLPFTKMAGRIFEKEKPQDYTESQTPEENPSSFLSQTFSFVEETKKLITNKQRKDLQIIAFYWKKKGFVFTNKEQFNTALKRELRPAKQLIGYKPKELSLIMDYCEDKYPDLWTLETCIKRSAEIINKNNE